MSEDNDELLTKLLRQDAPAARDALFRLRVLELRERKRFRRHVFLLCAAATSLVITSLIGIRLGGDIANATHAVLIIVAVTSVSVIYLPAVKRVLRRFSF